MSDRDEIAELIDLLNSLDAVPATLSGIQAERVRAATALATLRRERDEALAVAEGAQSLMDMAAGFVEGAIWKDRAEKAEAQLARAQAVVEAALNVDMGSWQTGVSDHDHMAVHPKDMAALSDALSQLTKPPQEET